MTVMDPARDPDPSTLEALFRPRSVAVVGASREPGSIGHAIVKNLIDSGFTGPVFPINPRARSVRGVPCYATIEEVPGELDLAVLVVPAPVVVPVLEQCGRKGVKAVVVISAGFREAGGEGVARELALRECAARHGIRIVGPNCMGVLVTDPEVRLNASFAHVAPHEGSVAFASQSGALGEAILARSRDLGLGLSAFVSLGNKADVSGNDLLAWWGQDPRTKVILLYLESLGDPRAFARAARQATRSGKPILVVKSGRTAAGARASASHTGSLAGVDEATTTLLERCGVQRVTRVEGLFNLARAFSQQPVPRGPRVAIVSNAGGPGIMAADAATAYGLVMATFSPQTVAAMRAALPAEASTNNPVDTIATASAQTFGACVTAALVDPGVDAVLPIYVGPSVMDVRAVAREIVSSLERARAVGAGGKPLLTCFMGGRVAEAREVLLRASIPAYDFPEDAAQALGAMARFRAWLDRPEGSAPALREARARLRALAADLPRGWLPAEQAFALLEAAGLQVAPRAYAASAEEAGQAAARVADAAGGWPVVLKADHPDLLHKTELGAVRLGLADADAVTAAARDLERRLAQHGLEAGRGRFLVQAQVQGGREVILGAHRDPAVGPVLLVGLGGIHAEVLRDVSLGVTPLTDRDAEDMLDGLRGAKLLTGYRGAAPVDRAALVDALLRLSALAEEVPALAELDVNPLLALERGAVVVDARVRLE